MRSTLLPRALPTTGGGDAPPTGLGPAGQDQESSSSDATSHTEEEDLDQTIPMEVYPPQTEGGTNHSWSDQVDDKEAWERQSSRHHKRHQGTSEYEGDPQTAPPFPFSEEARMVAVKKLFNKARATLLAQSAWVRLTLRHNIPASQCTDQGIVQLTNLLLVCVLEFHLTRSIRVGGS